MDRAKASWAKEGVNIVPGSTLVITAEVTEVGDDGKIWFRVKGANTFGSDAVTFLPGKVLVASDSVKVEDRQYVPGERVLHPAYPDRVGVVIEDLQTYLKVAWSSDDHNVFFTISSRDLITPEFNGIKSLAQEQPPPAPQAEKGIEL